MSKPLLIAFSLAGVAPAIAQTVPVAPRVEMIVTTSMASVYSQLTDTAKAAAYLSKGSDVQLLKAETPRWALVARGNKQYYIRRSHIGPAPQDPTIAPLTPAELAAVPRDANGAVHYSEVGAVEGATKDALYGRAKAWVINTYVSPKNVIQADDKDAGIVVCKGFSEVPVTIVFSSKQRLYYTVKISTKEGRYKYDLTDFYFQSYPTATNPSPEREPVEPFLANAYYPSNGKPNRVALSLSAAFIQQANAAVAKLKQAMSKGEDW